MVNNFRFFVDDVVLTVKFVSAAELGHLQTGRRVSGRIDGHTIKVPRYESWSGQLAVFWHELGHYLFARTELKRDSQEEELVEMFPWIAEIMYDRRNVTLRKFLGIRLVERSGPKRL